MKRRRKSKVPKWIEREEGKAPYSKIAEPTKQPMNFKKRDARKWRPAQNKGRGKQGGWWGH